MTTSRQLETQVVKEALKILPYQTRIRHGVGTGKGWIKIYIPEEVWEGEWQNVERMVTEITGRQPENNRIIVYGKNIGRGDL